MVVADPGRLDADLRQRAIRALLDDSGPSAWSAFHPYRKLRGAHWRLISLVELGVRDEPRTGEMLGLVLRWLSGERRLEGVPVIDGLARRCASQEGNALFVACRLGRAGDAEVLVEYLVRWQWPDDGWNCDRRPDASHSSFHETVWPLRGLVEYHTATGDQGALAAAHRADELLLRHRLFRSRHVGDQRATVVEATGS